jgi:hypothetical protein
MSKAEASKQATAFMADLTEEEMTTFGKFYDIDLKSETNLKPVSELKNDPGIYAKEKAIAAGKLPMAKSGSQANVAPIAAEPTAPPPQPKQAPVAPVAPKDPATEPAQQPPKDKAPPSATPGKPPPGVLPTDLPKEWESNTPTPQRTDAQNKVLKAVPLAREAVEAYSGTDYRGLNQALRNAEADDNGLGIANKLTTKQAAMVGALDVLTRIDQRDPPPATVYRGAGSNVAKAIDRLGVGNTWTDHGFISTSTVAGVGTAFSSEETGVVMRISTRQGVSISDASNLPGEREVLLPRGSRFRIKTKEWRWVKGKGSRLFVDLEHVDTN